MTEVFQQQKIKNLVDYVFGIETGLDTNARKNRSGHIMENMIARTFDSQNIPYRQEVYSSEWLAISEVLGDDEKRFDFVIQTPQKIFLIEVNFYSSGGSKLNEVLELIRILLPRLIQYLVLNLYGLLTELGGKVLRINFRKLIILFRVYIT